MIKPAIILSLLILCPLGLFLYFNDLKSSTNTQDDIGMELPIMAEDEVGSILESLTLEEKVGQMFMFGFDNATLNDWTEVLNDKGGVGGVLLLKPNIKDEEQLRLLTKKLQERLGQKTPLLIAVDQEGGLVNRVDFLNEKRGSDMIQDVDIANEVGLARGKELLILGINVNLAPVLDVVDNNTSFLYRRALRGGSQNISRLGAAIIKGQKEAGIASTAKHFPGHGVSITDSHQELPVSREGMQELKDKHLVPFFGAIDAGVDIVMAAHLLFEDIDSSPVPFSEIFMKELLRDELGFEGVVITDDLNMGAVTNSYNIEEAVIMAVSAGVDMIMIVGPKENQDRGYDALLSAVRLGGISEERVDESVYRILKLKNTITNTND